MGGRGSPAGELDDDRSGVLHFLLFSLIQDPMPGFPVVAVVAYVSLVVCFSPNETVPLVAFRRGHMSVSLPEVSFLSVRYLSLMVKDTTVIAQLSFPFSITSFVYWDEKQEEYFEAIVNLLSLVCLLGSQQ